MAKITNETLSLAEKVVDEVMLPGLVEMLGIDMPNSIDGVGVVGLLSGAARFAFSIKENVFSQAFAKFTNELKDISEEQKIQFYEKHKRKGVQEFGEQAILLLNKIEMTAAAKMLGKAHYLLVCGEIDEDTYYNYGHIIKNMNPYLLSVIRRAFEEGRHKEYGDGTYALLESLGLMIEKAQPNLAGSTEIPLRKYICSEFGIEFYEKIIQV